MNTPTVCVKNWTQGGNWITSFEPDEYEKYCRAIEQYGDDRLAIFEGQGLTPCGVIYKHWLIWTGKEHFRDLSDFWRIFRAQ